jgi:predicted RND superfamily exporter protein
MELRKNIGRLSFICFLMLLFVSLFLLPQLAALI